MLPNNTQLVEHYQRNWEDLSGLLNKYRNTVPKNIYDTLDKAITQWFDWYYKYEPNWPKLTTTQISSYDKSKELLNKSIAGKTIVVPKKDKPVPTGTKEVFEIEPLVVFGKLPFEKIFGWTLLGVTGIVILKQLTKN